MAEANYDADTGSLIVWNRDPDTDRDRAVFEAIVTNLEVRWANERGSVYRVNYAGQSGLPVTDKPEGRGLEEPTK